MFGAISQIIVTGRCWIYAISRGLSSSLGGDTAVVPDPAVPYPGPTRTPNVANHPVNQNPPRSRIIRCPVRSPEKT